MSGLLPGDTASVHVESEAAVYGGLQGVGAKGQFRLPGAPSLSLGRREEVDEVAAARRAADLAKSL
jgi:hypothetical protein